MDGRRECRSEHHQADTRRNTNVIMTWKRCHFNVIMTLLLCHVPVGPSNVCRLFSLATADIIKTWQVKLSKLFLFTCKTYQFVTSFGWGSTYTVHREIYRGFPGPSTIACAIVLQTIANLGKRERERLSLSAFLGTEGNGVHIVHISHVIITYTLEWLSSLTQITHNLQVIINLRKKQVK